MEAVVDDSGIRLRSSTSSGGTGGPFRNGPVFWAI